MAEPFYLFTRRRGGNFYVQFRMDDGTITAPKSTGTPNKKEAQLTAMRWLSSGEIPERVNSKDKSSKTKSLDLLEWMNYLKTYEFEHDDVQKIVDILVNRKMLVSGIVTASKESRPVDMVSQKSICKKTGKEQCPGLSGSDHYDIRA